MAAIRFVCTTDNKAAHEEIKRRLYSARGALMREKVYKDTSAEFQSDKEMMS